MINDRRRTSNMTTLRALIAAGLVLGCYGAAAAEVAKAQQAKAEDRVAARYFAEAKAKGKAVPAPQMAATSAPVAAAPAAKAAPAPSAKAAPAKK
jgi:hypothetical protein